MKNNMDKIKTPLAYLEEAIRKNYSKNELLELVETLFESEREMFVQAWINGNQMGWAMTTDWPSDGEKYFDDNYWQPNGEK